MCLSCINHDSQEQSSLCMCVSMNNIHLVGEDKGRLKRIHPVGTEPTSQVQIAAIGCINNLLLGPGDGRRKGFSVGGSCYSRLSAVYQLESPKLADPPKTKSHSNFQETQINNKQSI